MSIRPREDSTGTSSLTFGRPARWAILLALCIANIVLLTALVSTHHVRAQQRPAPAWQHPPAAPAAAAPPPATPAPEAAIPHRVLPAAPQRTIVLIDPAHGGPETGAQINDHLAEKDVTLALAVRLRSALQSHNFTVLSTRESDPAAVLTTDQRAEIANHSVAIACLVLHATGSGNGVHLFTSALLPDASHRALLPWATAQSAFAVQSALLLKQLNTALTRTLLPVVQAQTAVAPLDNLTCPAVVIEIAPLQSADGNSKADVSDPSYQAHVAESIATALVFWRGQNGPSASLPATAPLLAARPSLHPGVTP
ncbi:MAG: N-acetylmuramoyl-L-alanine amidase [Acidobacteriaceae bacterium]|nr:N-acetylmuramoyl-L-alanine amidase [Acidobacteriaceae bacterium]